MSISSEEILRALASVKLADGRSLPESGRLTQISAEDGKVIFSIQIDPSEVNIMESVRAQAENIVKALPGVSRALVGLTADKPASAAIRRPDATALGAEKPARRNKQKPRRTRRQTHYRRCVRQGRRRQVNNIMQPGAWLSQPWA